MIVPRSIRLCLIPKASGVGGMVTFRHKLAAGLAERGIDVCYDLEDTPYQAVLVIGGTRQLAALWRIRRQGVRIVQRLDGMNWLHRLGIRRGSPRIGLRHFVRAEYGNIVLTFIRARLAQHIIYQSEFTRHWWEHVRGLTPVPATVIHNGVDLNAYTPHGPHQRPLDRYRLLLVEGSLMGGYEQGVEAAVQLAKGLGKVQRDIPINIELMVVGRAPVLLQRYWEQQLAQNNQHENLSLVWSGLVKRDQIPEIDRSAHLLYSADINAACPNSVIEALACGLPVLSFDTGALPELVTGDSGRIIPYGGDVWQLDPPNVDALAPAAHEILNKQEHFRQAARARAEEAFGLDVMIDAYLDVLMS